MAKNVLVVDDDINALNLIKIVLERGGYNVLQAQNVDMALEILEQQHNPETIILDVMMPGMDGIEFCSMLRQRPDTAHSRIIILSARGDADTVISGMEAGADDYLTKPILHNDLLAKVQ